MTKLKRATSPISDPSSLVNHIKTYVSLSEDDILALNSVVQCKTIKKNKFLVHDGGVAAISSYILSGCLRTYITDKGGTEYILGFSTPGWWTGNLLNIYHEEPSQLYIQAVFD